MDSSEPNYVLRVLTDDHRDYIDALEQQQPDIVTRNMPHYFGSEALFTEN